jgi:tetratricopeptide (TPR) repeat protein
MEPGEALPLIPYALAGAGDDRQVDSLLILLGNANRETTACEEAVRIYQTVIRRSASEGPPASAVEGLARCALRLGLDAAALSQPEIAERWFRLAASTSPGSDLVRQALLGLGDARLEQGDSLEAAASYRRALDQAGAEDSLGQAAAVRLHQLQSIALPADTTSN